MVGKPSEKEQEYFITQEMKRLKDIRDQRAQEQAEAEKARLKELHFMHCAKCGQKMETTTLVEVEIEVCPSCGGVYLDSGELKKIVDKNNQGLFTNALEFAHKVWRQL